MKQSHNQGGGMCFSVQVERDLKKLAKYYGAVINQEAFDYLFSQQKKLPKIYKSYLPEDGRIYAKYWSPIVVEVKKGKEIRPMRYQLLPHFCSEDRYTRINPKTNKPQEISSTYNARIESLKSAKAWQNPFGKFHAILPIKSFYEWVPKAGKTAQIEFYDSAQEILDIACLYDNWYSADRSQIIQSFAIVTTEPTPEVMQMGHDRSPVVLQPSHRSSWLNPNQQTEDSLFNILGQPNPSKFSHRWVT